MKWFFAGFFFVVMVLSGCGPQLSFGGNNEPTYTRMGAQAPAWGSSPKYQQVGTFLEGKWAETLPPMDPESMKKMEELPILELYEFKAAGTFTIIKGSRKVGGTWQEANGVVTLTYTTLDGKPWNDAMAEIRARAETGTQGAIANDLMMDWMNSELQKKTRLTVDKDLKRLTFAPSAPPVAEGMASDPFASMLPTMERLKEK
jgi:hypothetical protein